MLFPSISRQLPTSRQLLRQAFTIAVVQLGLDHETARKEDKANRMKCLIHESTLHETKSAHGSTSNIPPSASSGKITNNFESFLDCIACGASKLSKFGCLSQISLNKILGPRLRKWRFILK